jgi:transposase-like protein
MKIMKRKERIKDIDFWLYSAMACGIDLTQLLNEIMAEEPHDILNEELAQETSGELVDIENLISSDDKQIKYIAQGYVNDEYCEYQILCPSCKSDKIAQWGSRNGRVKFKCKNKECDKKYFYLDCFVNTRLDDIIKPVAIWLAENGYPQDYIARVCGVRPTTINNWIKENHQQNENPD